MALRVLKQTSFRGGKTIDPMVIGIGLAVLLLSIHMAVRALAFPFTPDSAAYIDEARRVLAAIGMSGASMGDLPGPNTLFPPGFGIAIAALGFVGMDLAEAAFVLASVCALALPWMIVWAFRRVVPPLALAVVVLAYVTTPGVLTYSLVGLSEMMALCLGLATIGSVINGNTNRAYFYAGLFAGMGYLVRNANAALMVAFAAYCVAEMLLRSVPRRILAERVLVFAVGGAVIVLPLFCRNWILFGSINPYAMAPSTIDLLTNVRTMVQEFAFDVTGVRAVGVTVAWNAALLLAFAGVQGMVLVQAARVVKVLDEAPRRALLLTGFYCLLGVAMVVAARTRFEWGEPINIRHTLQYSLYWFVLHAIIYLSSRKSGGGILHAWKLGHAMVLLTFIGHAYYMYRFDGPAEDLARRSRAAALAFEAGEQMICDAGGSQAIRSNWPHVFGIRCGAKVGMISDWTEVRRWCGENDARSVSAARVAIFPERAGFLASDFPLAGERVVELVSRGCNVAGNAETAIVLSR